MNINNSTSPTFGKILNFENQIPQIFKNNMYDKLLLKKDYAELLDTFVKSEPIRDFVSKHDVNVKFIRDYDFGSAMTNMAVSIESPDGYPPIIWKAECFFDGLRARTGVKSLIKKIAGVTHENLDKAFKEHQARQINQNTNKEYCEIEREQEIQILDKKIQNSISAIENM